MLLNVAISCDNTEHTVLIWQTKYNWYEEEKCEDKAHCRTILVSCYNHLVIPVVMLHADFMFAHFHKVLEKLPKSI